MLMADVSIIRLLFPMVEGTLTLGVQEEHRAGHPND